jgi:hypothetical protein
MSDDPEVQHPRVIITPVSFNELSADDLVQLREQAAALLARFAGSDRLTEDLLFLLVKAAADEMESRAKDDTEWEHQLLSVVDWTAPPEQVKDDIGTLVAHILALTDDPDTRPAVRAVWYAFIAAVLRNRDALRKLGVSQ